MLLRMLVCANLVVVCTLLVACKVAVKSNVQADEPSTGRDHWPERSSSLGENPALENRVAKVLAQMSLEEKIGQMIQPEIKYVTPEDVKRYHLGSVLNGGGTAPNNDKFAPASAWVAMGDAFYHASMDTSDGRVAIPLIWGSDAVHGHNNVVGATLFPHNIGLGAARDPALIRRIGEATAREVAVTGVDWTFAPTVAVVRDVRWGRTYESYSEDPDIVKEYASMMIEGLQGNKQTEALLDNGHVVATAKHFLGDGGTHRGIDRGDTRVTEEELVNIHAAGFIAALDAGVQTVMASFNSWNGVKMHGNRYLLTDILKGRMGFDGFVVGDWNGHRQVPGCSVDNCPAAINAGLDMLMVPSEWKPLYKNTLQQAKRGVIPMQRIDDAVTRILRVKMRAGLFDAGKISSRKLAAKAGVMGGQEHRKLAREAVRKSLVLLKNNNALLPLNPKQNILVIGDAANDVAKQSGGWTLSWQGTGNGRSDFPNATTIYEGIQHAVNTVGGEAVLSEQGNFDAATFSNKAPPDVAVVIFGEDPYAEWHGDIAGIEFQRGSKSDLALLKSLKQQGIPVVSLFISGRPLWVNKEINASDAFVAAWLPGSEGAGIADVILTNADGQVQYDFTGKLSFSWPKFVHQAVINRHDESYEPLFAYGYGLTYSDNVLLANNLPENADTFEEGELDDAWLFVSRPMAPWSIYIGDGRQSPVEVTGNQASSGDDKNITVASIDKLSQEDARQIQWKGIRQGEVALRAEKPQNLGSYLEENAALMLDIRVDRKPTSSVTASISCDTGCKGSLALNDSLESLPVGRWEQISVDLQCFARQGVDFSQVSSALVLETQGSLALSVANIKFVPGMADSAKIRCGG